jgi:hypothetical protein
LKARFRPPRDHAADVRTHIGSRPVDGLAIFATRLVATALEVLKHLPGGDDHEHAEENPIDKFHANLVVILAAMPEVRDERAEVADQR